MEMLPGSMTNTPATKNTDKHPWLALMNSSLSDTLQAGQSANYVAITPSGINLDGLLILLIMWL